ncbi:amidohydrolase (plasmid) [Gemmatirosa kalamazoonensis]|uniref:Amidohydrolase n=1 Tax=Gemmatirosa kalamazoonensis TaxID=861299 RepID=W0RSP4_9BACT|nr:M20 family metallopeptidase [Gemmatirosa kalamazoonensis]AHG93497.1 amidohydrolase [Gemmatirosa kalamazoonensis]
MTIPSTGLPIVPDAVAPLFAPALAADLVALRRDLHRHPELSWRETRTAGALEAALQMLGVGGARRVLDTAVVARVPGRVRGAPVVAVRGDIDALPISEATGLAFASSVDGVMHACGHDVHATWAVGAAALLRATPAHGDVLVVLQPAEEMGQGAERVVASGALDEARAIFGAHVDRRFEVGQVVADVGPVNASTDSFDIELVGAGAHGARPHESADPVVALAAIVTAIQTLVARRLDPALPGVVTVGAVHAGSAPNVIPERATLAGTVRATLPAARALLTEELRRLTESVAAAYGCTATVTFKDGTPPVVNEPRATMWAREAAERVLGGAALVPFGTTNMGGEDFAFYLEKMPGCFMRVGAREPGGERIAAHSPRFYAAEESLFIGAAVLAEAARVASAALAETAA